MGISIGFPLISTIGRHPWLFNAWYSLRARYRHLRVTPDKEIVIEGFPRCANTFAVLAFESAQKRSVAVAHHLHAEAQLMLGTRFGLPVLVLIREPLGAVTSLVTRHPKITVGQAIQRYLDFYGCVEALRKDILVADFRQVTTDYASVIARLNERFGTHFLIYRNSQESDGEVFSRIDELNRASFRGAVHMIARPSEIKKQLLDSRRETVMAHPRLAECARLYDRLMDRTQTGPGG